MASQGLVGFEGSRSLAQSYALMVSGLVGSVVASGRGVATGCCPSGLDQYVRQAYPGCQVFRASAFGHGRSSFARRTSALVQAVQASGQGSALVVFPGRACPAGLVPSASSSKCFYGLGSGSWAAAALAAGLDVPVFVFGVAARCLGVPGCRLLRLVVGLPAGGCFRHNPHFSNVVFS